ncbi:hypothetical protein SeSB_A3064 [Salmonella enterica subsp. enterica serovar Schwarzengrund str. SL480]|uniref:Uncharacterized protein n=1 Tax=Salmonella schwarzengrund (strain CVM19633) TaxID=439843 RepID=A0A0N1QVR8_SALSV|nr:hypothetical protein SeSA_A2895 [Salmonella enterica subsp. enterica serovar Schwarzengrund str. CVM19633]EDY27844.1 hypothetical protein SeSB_A3064 [Salmonella enterica subsp. enterica serovar Schwarzengrund str. SL480]
MLGNFVFSIFYSPLFNLQIEYILLNKYKSNLFLIIKIRKRFLFMDLI